MKRLAILLSAFALAAGADAKTIVRVTAAVLAPGEMLQRRSAGLGMMLIVR